MSLYGYRYGQIAVAGTDGPVKGLWEALTTWGSDFGYPGTEAYTAFHRVGANRAVAMTYGPKKVVLRAVRGKRGPWRIQQPVGRHFHLWCTVSRSCPGQYAVGAGFIYFHEVHEGLYD